MLSCRMHYCGELGSKFILELSKMTKNAAIYNKNKG